MKKILALLLALVMVFALVACGETSGANGDESSEDTTIIISSEVTNTEVSSQAPTTNTEVSSQAPAVCAHKNIQTNPAIAADCGKEGKTEEKVCKDCGAVVVAGQTIPKDTQHFYTAATADKPATCTVCGATRGSVAAPETPNTYVSNPTKTENGATITFSISKVEYVGGTEKCNITYLVEIKNGPNAGSYSWAFDVGTGDTGSIIAGGFTGSTPSSLAPNENYTQTFETGPINAPGHFGYRLTFR